jgi:hypothetical protein
MPYLRELGERWAKRQVSVAQEHFASRLIEGQCLHDDPATAAGALSRRFVIDDVQHVV